ncbi:MAG: HAMP domain-containing protein [Candidatus Omnitrophica bacterium]|nr:HAMP domain-containing protein [Candidatus Omnitrophota bacterium]
MRITPKNIRVRLIAWYIFSLGCVHVLLAGVLYQTVSRRLHYELDQRLLTYSTCLVELLPRHRQLDLAEVIGEMAELTALGRDLYVRVFDHNGELIYEAAGLPPELAGRFHAASETVTAHPTTLRLPGHGLWRMVRREVQENGKSLYVGHVAIPLRGVHQALAKLLVILLLIVPAILLLSSAGAWLLLNRALSPLQEAIQTAQVIQARDFSQRLRVPKTGDEVQVLAETFNEMIERLQRSFERMQQFISDASHELRTPLTILKGEIELGLKTCPRSDRCDILAACSSEISRMSRLVETLLFLSNTDAEKVALDLKPIRLDRLMADMAEQAQILAEPKHIHVELINGANTILHGDEMKLRRLLLNLSDNAVKYTPEGGRIILRSRPENGCAEIQVADTGIGIEAHDLPRIFDRFYRVDQSRSRAEGGYGLGLAICKWIAEAHGGSIHVESSPGKGSTFSVRLPVA